MCAMKTVRAHPTRASSIMHLMVEFVGYCTRVRSDSSIILQYSALRAEQAIFKASGRNLGGANVQH